MSKSQCENFLKNINQNKLVMIVDQEINNKNGNLALTNIPLLQACGVDHFTYKRSWRLKNTAGDTPPRELGGYYYFSLANESREEVLQYPETLACFTTQEIENKVISISPIIHAHTSKGHPAKLCIVSGNETLTLRDSCGRPLRDETYLGRSQTYYTERLVGEAKESAKRRFELNCDYCASWSQLQWALAQFLVEGKEFSSTSELLDGLGDAPYLSFWRDIIVMTEYNDESQYFSAHPVGDPLSVLNRHYGVPLEFASEFWDHIRGFKEDNVHPYYRRKRILRFEESIQNALVKLSTNDLLSRLTRMAMSNSQDEII